MFFCTLFYLVKCSSVVLNVGCICVLYKRYIGRYFLLLFSVKTECCEDRWDENDNSYCVVYSAFRIIYRKAFAWSQLELKINKINYVYMYFYI